MVTRVLPGVIVIWLGLGLGLGLWLGLANPANPNPNANPSHCDLDPVRPIGDFRRVPEGEEGHTGGLDGSLVPAMCRIAERR